MRNYLWYVAKHVLVHISCRFPIMSLISLLGMVLGSLEIISYTFDKFFFPIFTIIVGRLICTDILKVLKRFNLQ